LLFGGLLFRISNFWVRFAFSILMALPGRCSALRSTPYWLDQYHGQGAESEIQSRQAQDTIENGHRKVDVTRGGWRIDGR